jgi:GTP cyclohydrolase II
MIPAPKTPTARPSNAPPEAHLEDVDRAVADLRRGSAVVIVGADGVQAMLVQSAETVRNAPFENIPAVFGPSVLLVTARRAAILGLAEPGPLAIALHGLANFSRETLAPFIDPEVQGPVPPPGLTAEIAAGGSPADSAIRLAKIARLLPATVAAPLLVRDAIVWAAAQGRSAVMASAIDSYDRIQAEDLRAVSEARVPLADSEQSRIISFRPSDGGAEHLAIVIGELDLTRPVLTRLHSECFTGDLLGSLRCDCGDQLRGAIQTIAKNGSGVLLYLAQEGRGIGLVNKLRAYRLQDYGFDTVDANEQLGFDDDERIYLPAFHILKKLGIARVRLLTNNPAKVGALARHGIEVTERVPHVVASNDHNRNYLATKAKRSGHLF